MQARSAPDYYAILQVDRNAHPLIITRVYRLLAALYHPDNRQTGDIERFRQVMEAGKELSDPVRRATYDKRQFGKALNGTDGTNVSAPVIEDQHSQRLVVLQALYNVRRNRPSQPDLPMMVFGELLGCSVDEAQFTLWYLRGKKLIEQTDDGWAITVAGVDYVETNHLETGAEGMDLLSLRPASRALESRYPPPPDPAPE